MPEEMGRRFPVVIEVDEDGMFITSCPLLRGCRSYGGSQDEALANIREAIELCLQEGLGEEGNRFIGVRELEIGQDA